MRDERHFQVELGEFGLPVAPLALVSKALGDLVVPLKTSDHKELLVLLWALGQGVKFAWVQAIGHKVIASPFWSGFGNDRRFNLYKSAGIQIRAQLSHGSRANCHSAEHGRSAKIKIAIFDAQLFVHVRHLLFVAHLERKNFGRAEKAVRSDDDFDIAGGHVRISRALAAHAYFAGNA